MNINLVTLWAEMGLAVKIVVVVLTIQAIASLAVAVDRLILLWRSNAASRSFAERAAPMLDREQIVALYDLSKQAKGSHLATLMQTALKVYLERVLAGDPGTRAADLARRAIERRGESISDELHRGMNVLASTGSTAPFVGLLGTVLGIIHAFQMIAASGSGGIGTIGSAIGEALIVTGYGLCVAIPTVLLFNWISARISRFEMGLTNAGSELADRLEVADAASVSSPGSLESPDRDRDDEPRAARPALATAEA